jgi:hypothetical protein
LLQFIVRWNTAGHSKDSIFKVEVVFPANLLDMESQYENGTEGLHPD